MSALSLVPEPAQPTRSQPIRVVGAVAVLAPTGSSPYYRLTWTNPDGTAGRTTAGKTEAGAVGKAEHLAATLRRAAGGKAMTPLSDIVAEYLSSPQGRNGKTGGDWGRSQLKQMRAKLKRCLRGHTTVLAMEVDRDLLDRMRSQAGTRRTRRENATALRGLLRWGASKGYFTAEQAELLPTNVYDLTQQVSGTEAPPRRHRSRSVGESEDYIADEDAPSGPQIIALGEQLQLLLPWGRLAPELAADCGARWGEMFQLTAYDVVVTPAVYSKKGKLKQRAKVHVKIDWQVDPAGEANSARRKRPKGYKRRKAGVGETSITGYALHKALLARRDEALREQAAGKNEQALLFPTETGKMFHYTAFINDYFKPAALAAGWPHQKWIYVGSRWDEQQERWVQLEPQDRVQFDLTWHSLRHRYARTCVDLRKLTSGELMAHGGWENEFTVRGLYYNSGEEHFESGSDKF